LKHEMSSSCSLARHVDMMPDAYLFLESDQAGPLLLQQPLKSSVLGIIQLKLFVIRLELQSFESGVIA
jgi:hypothetical protein